MRTYDYILAMREAGAAFDPFEDSDSDESIDFDSPEKPSFFSRVFCRKDEVNEVSSFFFLERPVTEPFNNNKAHFQHDIECAEAVDQGRERPNGCFRKEG